MDDGGSISSVDVFEVKGRLGIRIHGGCLLSIMWWHCIQGWDHWRSLDRAGRFSLTRELLRVLGFANWRWEGVD